MAAEGAARSNAVRQAADSLLGEYFRRWMHLIPVELHRLSAMLRTEVVRSKTLKGEAVLMPTKDGFRIVVNSSSPVGRYRASVAHELAHTLFYDGESTSVPVRRISHTRREEHFCFDVARYVLAPKQHLDAIGVFDESDPSIIFAGLTGKLLLSRPWAARVMLADYALAKGIAGRWKRTEQGWTLEYGSSSASPDLSQRERRKLREAVGKWLDSGTEPPRSMHIASIEEKLGEGIFVLIVEGEVVNAVLCATRQGFGCTSASGRQLEAQPSLALGGYSAALHSRK